MVFGTVSGIVRGRVIELNDDVNLPDGAPVQIVLVPKDWQPGDGIRRSAGAWRDVSEADYQRLLTETEQGRDESSRTLP